MSLLDRLRKTDKGTWCTYQDFIGNKRLSVRVDTKFADKNYKNTFYIQVKHSETEDSNLPDKEFLNYLADLEEKVISSVKNTFGDNIVFLGTATFGGSSYITFASDLDVMWSDYVKEVIDKNLSAGIYPDDNMGYYKQVLYPEFIRK